MADLPRTPESLELIEDAIAAAHGSISRAAHQLGFRPHHLHLWMKSDPTVYERIRAAQLIGHASLEDVAIERATEGVTEDVYFQGNVVGQKQVYSDGLLTTLLKARVEGFAPEQDAHRGLTVNVAIMPRASTYEEWLTQRDLQLAETKQIEHSPDPIEDAQYVEISTKEKSCTTASGSEPYEDVSPAAKAAYVLMRPTEEPNEQPDNTTRLRDVL